MQQKIDVLDKMCIRDRCIDHCHKTGKIRGLLCDTCNRALGLFKDDIQMLKNSVAYLEKYK